MRRRCGPPGRFGDAQYVLGCLAAACLAGVPAQGQCGYDITIIQAPVCPAPLPEPPATYARGLNELGHVVGYYDQCEGSPYREAFLWTPDAGLTTLVRPAGVITAKAFDINDAGQVVGELDISGDGLGVLAFLHDGNGFMEIPPFGGTFSQAEGISNQTEVTGTTGDGSPFFKAYLWENDVMTLILPTFGPRSAARDINEARQIVGWMGLSPSIDAHAFLWEDGVMVDLGVIPGGFTGTGSAINNFGQVVVNGNLPFKGFGQLIRAFLWTNSEFTDLGTLPGLERCSALDINDEAQIVGMCSQPNLQGQRPFIWQNGVMTDLTLLIADDGGLQLLTNVRSINNAGQITGSGIGPDGFGAAALLTPIAASPSDINVDGVVNVLDLIELLLCFGQSAQPPCNLADVDGSGVVNVLDLIDLLLAFGSACP